MKLVLYRDDFPPTVYQNITDLYIAIRQETPVSLDGKAAFLPETTSHSWGGNIRELVKEVQQSLVELQDILKEHRHGGSS